RVQRRYEAIPERDLERAVEKARLLIVAVRPASVRELLNSVGDVERSVIAISLAAGIRLGTLRDSLPSVRWARAMPSPVCSSGRGLTAICFDRNFPRAARDQATRLFSKVGGVLEIRESRFDAFTVAYSSSHGYHALAALAGAAQKLGLDRQ